ncbi:MAG TPA: class I SAM-dependent rRNA methyltransferase [Candidatus Baltobacteraceae bacterium]
MLRLLPNADRRIRLGHAWIFSNEVDVKRTPLANFAAGELTAVVDARGKGVGLAYVNPNALICARVLTSDTGASIDQKWLVGRMRRALALRGRVYPSPHYRAIYGESDGLPGMVVDRYGETLVAQLNTAGCIALRDGIVGALHEVFEPSGIALRTAGSVRALEGIAGLDESIGEVPDRADVVEGDVTFIAPLRGGQKTGFFYDQRDNRSRLQRYVSGANVLDAYSYIGTWGVRAARFGAKHVTCVDSSVPALEIATENARHNGVSIATQAGDAIEVLEAYAAAGRRFDVVIVDPPALIKRKRDIAAGESLYERLNRAALRVLVKDGVLVSSSCSHHLSATHLQRVLLHATRAENRRAQILERHGHAPDHPIHPAMPETEYLKTFFVRA